MGKKKEEPDPREILEKFLKRAVRIDDTIYVAIDPGAQGAMAFLCGPNYTVVDIPTIKTEVKRTKATSAEERKETGHKTKTITGSTTKYNFGMICELFKLLHPYRDWVVLCLERVPFKVSRGRGYTSADVMINRAYAMWPLFIHSKGYALEEPMPAQWKQKMGLIGKDKEAGRLKALSLFPKADILRKMDHDRAEALLIAEFVRRTRSDS